MSNMYSSAYSVGSSSNNMFSAVTAYQTQNTTNNSMQQMFQNMQMQNEQTQMSMMNNQLMHETNMWKQVEEVQTKIFETRQEVLSNRSKAQTKAFNNWTKAITS